MILALMFLMVRVAGFEDICRNQTILQTPGDALLTVFVDATVGPYCNESSSKGFQELTTALYVTTTLNRENYVPGVALGLRIMDTCQDVQSVQKQSLLLAAELDCPDEHYNLGILAPESYISVLQPLQDFTDLPVSFYFNDNITKPLVNIAIDFVTGKYETIDLVLTDTDLARDAILEGTRKAGICVETFNNLTKLDSADNGVIVAAGMEKSIRLWLRQQREKQTWIIVPLDDSEADDIVPVNSYLIRSSSLFLDLEDHLTPSNASPVHSPHLLTIGKSLLSIAELLSDIHENNCPLSTCELPTFDTRLLKKITPIDIFNALKTPETSRTIQYVISKRFTLDEDLTDVVWYQVNVNTYQVVSNVHITKNINHIINITHVRTCWDSNSCQSCANFHENSTKLPDITTSPIRTEYWVPVVVVFVLLGLVLSLAVAAYIIYKFLLTEPLDGNPILTLILILGNIFLLLSTIPFCLEEKVFGSDELNARKIFVATLAAGFVFSVMLSRSFFLAFSTGGVYSCHINGYLQGVMLFFVFLGQFGLSTMYFIVGSNAEVVLKSPAFLGLLTYDIFLLASLLGVGWLIQNIPRNYQEGKCLFFTAMGLLSLWFLWTLIFLCVNSNWRDIILTFALVFTAYGIIIGVFLPRVYFMVTHPKADKTFQGHVEGANLRFEPRRRTIRQPRKSFYDYVLPMEGISSPAEHPGGSTNFYGTSSPNDLHHQSNAGGTEMSTKGCAYSNYGYHNEMQEGENHYVVPRVCVIGTGAKKKNRGSAKSAESSDSDYAQPNYPGMRDGSLEDDCLETELYLDSKRLSPKRGPNETYPSRCSTPRLHQTEATIDEEEEEAVEMARVTRF